MSTPETDAPAAPQRHLGVLDAICIVVGIVIGSFIFFLGPFLVAQNTTSPGMMLLAWVAGGFLCLCGALCYAELSTTYPRSGGEYSFINRAFGPEMGFLFVWARSTVIQTGSIAMLAYVFGKNMAQLAPIGAWGPMVYALLAIAALTALNVVGWKAGKWTQNLLTAAKVLGVAAIILVGLLVAPAAAPPAAPVDTSGAAFGLAMVFVLMTFGGWNEAAYVAGEVRNARRNMIWVLLGSIALLTVLYLAVNVAYLRTLGFAGLRGGPAVAAATMGKGVGDWGGTAITILIAVSALGAVNGCVFTGARAVYALGTDYRSFGFLGRWHARLGTPIPALVVQSCIAAALVLLPNLGEGFQKAFGDGAQAMVEYTAPVFWLFMMLVGLTVFILRTWEPDIERPFRVPFFPITVVLFVLMCGYMVYSSLAYTRAGAWVGVGVLLAGVPLNYLCGRTRAARSAA
ncbi:MAG TPA: amino acid permease [Planctomycetota bacterium]|nr:amino acid permease [Planctomycetota bacterium]